MQEKVTTFLEALVTGPRSLASLLETNCRYRKLFEESQAEEKGETGLGFAKTIRNLAYAEQRYDSRARPLFRLFTLLPVAIDTLQKLTQSSAPSERESVQVAKDLLEQFSGDSGFTTVINAAVAADAMVIGWGYIRLDDSAAADYSLTGPRAAELLQTTRALLASGGLFLSEADGTLTHAALRAMTGRVVFLGSDASTAACLRWPSPSSPKRREPIRFARESGSRFLFSAAVMVDHSKGPVLP